MFFFEFKDLIQHVYGFSLESMYGENTEMAEKLTVAKSRFQRTSRLSQDETSLLHEKERTMRIDHINARLSSGRYYTIKRSGQHIVFQVVCKHPERRSYVQRVCFLGKDVSSSMSNQSFFVWSKTYVVPVLIPKKLCFVHMLAPRHGMAASQ